MNDYNINTISSTPNFQNNPIYSMLVEDKQNNPSIYGEPQIPPSWSFPYGISSYIDAPMHLIFLGCVKLMNKRILDWSSLFKKETQLLKTFSSLIPSIYDMKLEWCKIFPLSSGGSFSVLLAKTGLLSHVYPDGCTVVCHGC